MDALEYWRLNDELTVSQAAFLIAGADPSDYPNAREWPAEKIPKGYEAAKDAIYTALGKAEIEGVYVKWPELFYDYDPYEESRVMVESLRAWLKKRGRTKGFFFPNGSGQADYLDPSHPRYAPKLAAAVKAWLAMENEPPVGSSPKKALERWLRDHAEEFGLIREDGGLNTTGIGEISKVANWQLGGGAPKIPF